MCQYMHTAKQRAAAQAIIQQFSLSSASLFIPHPPKADMHLPTSERAVSTGRRRSGEGKAMASKLLAAAKALVVLLLLVSTEAQAARSSRSTKGGGGEGPSFLGRIGRYIRDVPGNLLKEYADHCGQIAVSECLKVRNPECLKVVLEECGLKP